MMKDTGKLICVKCQKSYSLDESRWRCDCGHFLDIDFKASFDLDKIKSREPGMWRYREAIPINNDENIVSYNEGFTPLIKEVIDDNPVLFKQDHLFPTGSFKDRGASVLISKVKEMGIGEVVEDSSGNAGASMAGYCAKAGIRCHIYVPQSTSPGKLAQIQSYGAELNAVPGSREDTAQAVKKAAESIYYASHYWNPFFFHGVKTIAYEICEQLEWNAPDVLVLPAGNGSLLLGAFIGFTDLVKAKIIDKFPRFVAVQSENCAPLFFQFSHPQGELAEFKWAPTLAEGIAIAEPLRGPQILDAVRKSNGMFLTVEESEIKGTLVEMCKRGHFIEPTSAAVVAGVKKFLWQNSGTKELIVSLFTGHGLKASEKICELMKGI
jgi:threonine synthase